MKRNKGTLPVLVTIFALLSALLLGGCGGAGDQTTATATDIIVLPADSTETFTPVATGVGCFAGGVSILETPVLVTVTDSAGNPKNGIFVDLYTDGFWSSDANYNGDIVGVGPFNMRQVETDANGRATVFWSTELLPPAMDPTGGPPPDTAGEDRTGTSFIQAYSGVHSETFSVNWTVKGCQP